LASTDTVVLGASFDSPEDNQTFAEAEQFGFRLLSDGDKRIGALYEVTRPSGDERAGFAMRIAYLIDPRGIIRKAYEVTDTGGFAEQVLDDVQVLRSALGS
jgi:thioredoxin-dependent peroxiredoxin